MSSSSQSDQTTTTRAERLLKHLSLGDHSKVAVLGLSKTALAIRPKTLQQRKKEQAPEEYQRIIEFRKDYGNEVLCEVTVDQALLGMRGIIAMVCETSLLDPNEGIRYRGYSIPELTQLLPKAPGGSQALPEGALWLLVTGEIPTESEVWGLSEELKRRATLPEVTIKAIDSYPDEMHPMTQLSSALLTLQAKSHFAAAYMGGVHRSELWEPCLEDALDIIAKLPHIAARVYRNKYRNGRHIAADSSMDYAQNFAHMLGFDSEEFYELMRMYLTIHADHEGGNVSAHTAHLVGSALSDPYLAYSAGLNGLAGPLHGLACQQVLQQLLWMKQCIGHSAPTKEKMTKLVWDLLNNGQVISGYGHAVLRKTDPRYLCQREFALKHVKNDQLFDIVNCLYEVVPPILKSLGRVRNPFPNVDAHSGVLMTYYGLTENPFYTVMFGVSRALGVMSGLVTSRVLGLPIERPKSGTTEWIRKLLNTKRSASNQ